MKNDKANANAPLSDYAKFFMECKWMRFYYKNTGKVVRKDEIFHDHNCTTLQQAKDKFVCVEISREEINRIKEAVL